jgi:hypothetical protein
MKLYGNQGRFTQDPGKVHAAQCSICDAPMTVERNVLGPTSWAESSARNLSMPHQHLHDVFTCPNYTAAWHERIIELLHEAQEIKSRKLRAIVEEEIAEILKTKEIPEEEE